MGDFHVTTGADENDAGASVTEPGGSGLSLREALQLANAMGGAQTVTFDPGIVVELSTPLPDVTEAVTLWAAGAAVNATNMAGNANCFTIRAGPTLVSGLEFYGCPAKPILVDTGSDIQITGCYFHDNEQPVQTASSAGTVTIGPDNRLVGGASHGIALYSPNAEVVGNTFLESASNGVFVAGTSTGTRIVGNLIVRCGNGVGLASTADGAVVWHNTIVQSVNSAVVIGQASGADVRNNILTHSGDYGLVGPDGNFAAQDNNLFFQSGIADCTCDTLGPSSVTMDPAYTDAASDDFTLSASSPAIDAGVDTGIDRNGSRAGLFDGDAPDIGYVETN